MAEETDLLDAELRALGASMVVGRRPTTWSSGCWPGSPTEPRRRVHGRPGCGPGAGGWSR